jgi:glyoxylase-like metal-dependent hydrolase (beta-lactamase superfamily II)
MHSSAFPSLRTGLAAALPLAGLCVTGPLAAQAAAPRSRLHLEEVVADTANFNVASTLIVGPTQVVLFDAQNRMSDGRRVAERIAATGRRLTAIFLSHPDEDHFFGALAILERFPGTPVYMAPAGLEEFHRVADGYRTQLEPRMGAEAPDSLIHPEALPPGGLSVDGERLEVIADLQGDVLTPANSAIWIPSLGAVLAGDIVFNGVHPYLAASTEASRQAWRQSLDRLIALKPEIVVAGHKASAELPDTPASLQFMQGYLDDFEAALRGSPNLQGMVNTLRAKYPDLHVAMLLGYSASMTYGK